MKFLHGTQDVGQRPVREINGINDLLRELHHYGKAGPMQEENTVYYRFGDWVVGMNTQNFYVTVKGIVTSETDSDEIKNKKTEIFKNWKKIPEDYPKMQPRTGDNFFDDINSWINGEHNRIGLDIEMLTMLNVAQLCSYPSQFAAFRIISLI